MNGVGLLLVNEKMKCFHDQLENCNSPKTLILGNGFGRSYDVAFGVNKFSWNTLVDLCEIKKESEVYELLKECHFDFELAHQKLNNAADVIARYSLDDPLLNKLRNEVRFLQEQLIVAVTKSHPDSFNKEIPSEAREIVKNKVDSCRRFLLRFDNVFSLNYDLLLYWVRNFDSDPLGQDSFTKVSNDLMFDKKNPRQKTGDPKKDAMYYFPHGALFLLRKEITAIKTCGSTTKPILAKVEESIRIGVFPMCISEGTGKQKHDAICTNEYLRFAYDKIKSSEGTIFTFGCSFLDGKDDHIIEAMFSSNAKAIVVGGYNLAGQEFYRLSHTFQKIRDKLNKNVDVVIADTSDTQIWGP